MDTSRFSRTEFYSRLQRVENELAEAIRQRRRAQAVQYSWSEVAVRIASYDSRVRQVMKAVDESEGLALKEIQRKVDNISMDAVWPVLRLVCHDIALYLGGSTLVGGAIGGGLGFFAGGVGAIPGAAAGSAVGVQVGNVILGFLGLKCLVEYMVDAMPRALHAYREGFTQAWGRVPDLRANSIDAPHFGADIQLNGSHGAAQSFAQGHVIMVVALLTAIVAYLTRGKGTLASLAAEVRQSSRLGPKFAAWLDQNADKLVRNPMFSVSNKSNAAAGAVTKADAAGAAKAANPAVPAHLVPKRPRPAANGFKGPDGYVTYGIKDHPLNSAEGRRMVTQYKSQGMTDAEALRNTIEKMESGSTLPDAMSVNVGDKLYKVVPEGSMPGQYSAYFATEKELNALRGMSYDQISDRIGIPLESQQTLRFDVVEVTATRPTTVFDSVIARTTQNGYAQPGGGVQTLITDRGAFTDPIVTGIKFP
jgi:hypothetical protein